MLGENPHRLAHEHLPYAPAAVAFSHVELSHLALEPGPGVVEHDPTEADHVAALVAHRVDDVLAAKRRRDLGEVPLDLFARQLRVVRIMGLLSQMELHEKRLDHGVIAGREPFHVERSHPESMVAYALAASPNFNDEIADVAQLAEQPPRKWQVVGSNPTVRSK